MNSGMSGIKNKFSSNNSTDDKKGIEEELGLIEEYSFYEEKKDQNLTEESLNVHHL
jgi:hypothetical protein